ncbi:unnamed protein product [Chrysodeixis includens]|uniref:Uncharacterized protein n=1 Tax=Chrysodeixis includens TaxID=689277 RepID=A0A9N8Q0C0_CHRIL|nr:unnamed protein product [Chrysodeixis includens]
MPPNLSDTLLPDSTPRKLSRTPSLQSCSSGAEQCSCDEVSYGIGDAIFSCFVVAPHVVSVWRATWGLMELQPRMFPFAQTYLLGIVIHVCFAVARSRLLSRSTGAWSDPDGGACAWLRERIISRVYTYIFILSNIMQWRGGWGLLDMFVDKVLPDVDDPHRPVLIATLTITFFVAISLLRAARNLLASPYFLVTDGKEPTYIFSTRFNTSAGESLWIPTSSGEEVGSVRLLLTKPEPPSNVSRDWSSGTDRGVLLHWCAQPQPT